MGTGAGVGKLTLVSKPFPTVLASSYDPFKSWGSLSSPGFLLTNSVATDPVSFQSMHIGGYDIIHVFIDDPSYSSFHFIFIDSSL